jgi:hypothetical protein
MDMTNRVRGPGLRSLTSMVCQLCAGFIPAAETTGKKPPADCRLAVNERFTNHLAGRGAEDVQDRPQSGGNKQSSGPQNGRRMKP